jgi:hypothetical protein
MAGSDAQQIAQHHHAILLDHAPAPEACHIYRIHCQTNPSSVRSGIAGERLQFIEAWANLRCFGMRREAKRHAAFELATFPLD